MPVGHYFKVPLLVVQRDIASAAARDRRAAHTIDTSFYLAAKSLRAGVAACCASAAAVLSGMLVTASSLVCMSGARGPGAEIGQRGWL